jgi:hypothetical protein
MVWVQLARWTFDKIHVDLIGRQTQIQCPESCNFDQLLRIFVHDDAYRDECQSLGSAKLRIFERLVGDGSLFSPMEELEPYSLVDGYGIDGRDPLIVVAPSLDFFPFMLSSRPVDMSILEPPKKRNNLEEKRIANRIRQQRCRARKKVTFIDVANQRNDDATRSF